MQGPREGGTKVDTPGVGRGGDNTRPADRSGEALGSSVFVDIIGIEDGDAQFVEAKGSEAGKVGFAYNMAFGVGLATYAVSEVVTYNVPNCV
jgi:hypothetical protein